MKEDQNQEGELTTWQEIADHLKVSVRTAQKYEKEMGLPVRRMIGGIKGRVIAYSGELDRWKAEQLTPAAVAEPGRVSDPAFEPNPRPHSAAAEGTPKSTRYAKEQPAVAIAAPLRELQKKRLTPALMVSGVIVAAIGLLLVGPRYFWPKRIPVAYRIEVATLITLDGQGKEVWRHRFPEPFDESSYRTPEARYDRGIFTDLDGTGESDLVFRYTPAARTLQSILICFSPSGKERWRFVPGRPVITDASGDRFYPPYRVYEMGLIANERDHRARIVVSSPHHMQAPDQVAVLDGGGKLVGEFWHPGHLLHMTHADLDHDGKEELLLAGVNNGYQAATLLVFDPDNVHGTTILKGAPLPGLGLVGFSPSTEKAIVLFPRTCLSRHKQYNRAVNVIVLGNNTYITVVEDPAETSPAGILYTLGSSLSVLAADPLPGYQAAHRELYRTGVLNHELTPEEINGWKKAVVVIKH